MSYTRKLRGGKKSLLRRGGTKKAKKGNSLEKKRVAALKKVTTAEKSFAQAEKNLQTVNKKIQKNLDDASKLNNDLILAEEKLEINHQKLLNAKEIVDSIDHSLNQYRMYERNWSPKTNRISNRHSI